MGGGGGVKELAEGPHGPMTILSQGTPLEENLDISNSDSILQPSNIMRHFLRVLQLPSAIQKHGLLT